jgi:uncharacterized Rossmann fold enzyme
MTTTNPQRIAAIKQKLFDEVKRNQLGCPGATGSFDDMNDGDKLMGIAMVCEENGIRLVSADFRKIEERERKLSLSAFSSLPRNMRTNSQRCLELKTSDRRFLQ